MAGRAARHTRPVRKACSRAPAATHVEQITLGGGCFWCVEAALKDLMGVERVVSGYAGGSTENPTYEQVCSGRTGHAEVVQVTFDPEELPLQDLLEVFFTVHDPTTPNRQGADVGTQYRSIILTQAPGQEQTAQDVMSRLADAFPRSIVTQVEPLDRFYEAEEYHQDYYARNPGAGYCQAVISPKLAKVRQKWAARLRA